MPLLLTDENFNGHILAALRQAAPDLDVVRVQDVGLRTREDEHILAWAAQENRIVLSHDIRTMKELAYNRVRAGLPMPGVIIVRKQIPLRQAVDEIVLMLEGSFEDEFENQVRFIPM